MTIDLITFMYIYSNIGYLSDYLCGIWFYISNLNILFEFKFKISLYLIKNKIRVLVKRD